MVFAVFFFSIEKTIVIKISGRSLNFCSSFCALCMCARVINDIHTHCKWMCEEEEDRNKLRLLLSVISSRASRNVKSQKCQIRKYFSFLGPSWCSNVTHILTLFLCDPFNKKLISLPPHPVSIMRVDCTFMHNNSFQTMNWRNHRISHFQLIQYARRTPNKASLTEKKERKEKLKKRK